MPKLLYCYLIVVLISLSLYSCGLSNDNDEKIAESIKNEKDRAAELFIKGEYEACLETYRHIINVDPDVLPADAREVLPFVYSDMGYVLFYINQDYVGAYEAFTSGLAIAESEADSKALPVLNLNLANVYGVYGDLRLAQKHWIKAFDEAVYRQNYDVMTSVVYNLLICAMSGTINQGGLERLNKFNKMNIPDCQLLPIVKTVMQVYKLYGQGHYQDGIDLLNQIKRDSRIQLGFERLINLCDINALRLATDGNLPDQQVIYVKNLEESLDSVDSDIKPVMFSMLVDYYLSKGDYKRAVDYMTVRNSFTDSIFSANRYSLLHDVHFNMEKKRHSNEMQKEEEKGKVWFNWFMSVLVYVVVLVIALVVMIMQIRRLKRRNQKLYLRSLEMQKQKEELYSLRKITRIGRGSLDIGNGKYEDAGVIADAGQSIENNDDSMPMTDAISSKQNVLPLESPFFNALADMVTKIMSDEDEIVQKDFSLDKLARLAQSNRYYVSRIINTIYQNSFTAVVSELRVSIACRRLSEPGKWRNMTIEALAESVGFKSRSNFVVVFKKITGLTPSEYRKSVCAD